MGGSLGRRGPRVRHKRSGGLAPAVRAGLVAVGAAIAIVGAGIVVAVGLPVSEGSHSSQSTASAAGTVSPGAWYTFTMNATAASQATDTFSWSANGPAEVQWYAAVSCSTPRTWCVEGGPLQLWANTTSGHWSNQGASSAIYCVWVNDTAGHALNFTGSFAESAVMPPTRLPTLFLAWLVVGGSLLAGIGGIGVYLGLFLPTDVYARGDGIDDPDDDGGIIDDMHGPPNGRA